MQIKLDRPVRLALSHLLVLGVPVSHRDIVILDVRNLAAIGWSLSLFVLISKQTWRLI